MSSDFSHINQHQHHGKMPMNYSRGLIIRVSFCLENVVPNENITTQ
jgi:hypothetical protein